LLHESWEKQTPCQTDELKDHRQGYADLTSTTGLLPLQLS
jgi:hypothetical protein